jgi:hypothetical protein
MGPHLQVNGPKGGVAYIPYSDATHSDHVEAHADQRLIAAAPDLLEALRVTLRMVEAEFEELAGNHPGVRAARAAIAKAEGRS